MSNDYVLKLKKTDTYMCTADYGWVTGFYYGFILPFFTDCNYIIIKNLNGNLLLKSLDIIQKEKVNKLYTTPLIIKKIYRFFKNNNYTNIEIFSVGEKLEKEVKEKYEKSNIQITDTWWQTELGCITIADIKHENVLGKPLDFVNIGLYTDKIETSNLKNKKGELLIKTNHPSIFKGYLKNKKIKFIKDFYKTGDIVKVNENNSLEYISRADDVIVRGGELISPYEIEDFIKSQFNEENLYIINENNKIILKTTKILNFEEIKKEIYNKLSPIMVPDRMDIIDNIPKTYSGKTKR